MSRSLAQSLLDRLQAHWRLKLGLFVGMPLVLTGLYAVTQRHILMPERTLPSTWLDRAIPFQPEWTWVYLSLYVLMPIGPLLTRSRDDLLRYVKAIVFFFAIAMICFVLFPVAGPRPPESDGWLHRQLIRIDRPYNSIPSLHATCAVFAALYAAYASRDSHRRMLRLILLSLAWVWVALILYSTIATRQHFAVDLPPGIVLAVAAICWGCLHGRQS